LVAHVVVVGAGIAGLLAAHALRGAGHVVTVLDKGHQPGGRLATRRIGTATFDTGAQFLTVRDPRVAAHLDAWLAAGVVRPWFRGAPDLDVADEPDGHPRYRGDPTMRSLPQHLAEGLPIRLATMVIEVVSSTVAWRLTLRGRDGRTRPPVTGDALLLTPPIPQTRELLATVPLEPATSTTLAQMTFDPCLAILAVPDGPTALPPRGAVRLAAEPVAWITDNLRSGASATPAVTVHATAAVSREHWNRPDHEVGRDLLRAARPVLGCGATMVGVHRWRYAAPLGAPSAEGAVDPAAPALLDRAAGPPLAIAGDALTAGRIEGAARSGLAAADALIAALR
jgi:renalase